MPFELIGEPKPNKHGQVISYWRQTVTYIKCAACGKDKGQLIRSEKGGPYFHPWCGVRRP